MSQNHTTIRPAVPADAQAIAEMANDLNRLHGKPDDLYSAELVAEQAFGEAPVFSILVAVCDGALVGYAFLEGSFNSDNAARGGESLLWGVMSDNADARAFYAGLGARDEDARILELDGAALTGLVQAARG